MTQQTHYEVHPLPLAALVHLINEWGDIPRAEAGESESHHPQPEALRELEPGPWNRTGLFDLPTLIDAANRLYPLFSRSSPEERADHINHLIHETAMHPVLTADGWSIREIWRSGRPQRRLLAGATLTLIKQLRYDPDARRLGTCHGDACADAYIDQSAAGRRQFCSLTCQNRHRTRAYRARRRADHS
ncbi:CGNR zinc finger domain-containing protein [Nesterenkonia muleiensis]|uniref:CGNR zinc finger domain-containing protein n=1 Tax=Nesterenkonia muleiensis TaxID=2282648 RepID=UPI000E73B40E|nr:CGNR zinc finger domain-containing protein [Nesterenkonia muleiensis]